MRKDEINQSDFREKASTSVKMGEVSAPPIDEDGKEKMYTAGV